MRVGGVSGGLWAVVGASEDMTVVVVVGILGGAWR